MFKKITVYLLVLSLFISCTSSEERDVKKNEKIQKIAIIEFAILPPEFVDQMIMTSSSVLLSIASAIINASKSNAVTHAQEKLYPDIVKLHDQIVDEYCEFASEYWDKRTGNQIIDTKSLYKSSLYRTLPEKGIKTYPLKLSQEYSTFPRISVPSKSYNFFEISKSCDVLKTGVPTIEGYDISESAGYNTKDSESLVDKQKRLTQNLSAISSALKVDLLAVINVSVATGVDTKPYQHLLIRILFYNKNGVLIDGKTFIGEQMRGDPSDINHYKALLGNFKNQFVKMIDQMCFRQW